MSPLIASRQITIRGDAAEAVASTSATRAGPAGPKSRGHRGRARRMAAGAGSGRLAARQRQVRDRGGVAATGATGTVAARGSARGVIRARRPARRTRGPKFLFRAADLLAAASAAQAGLVRATKAYLLRTLLVRRIYYVNRWEIRLSWLAECSIVLVGLRWWLAVLPARPARPYATVCVCRGGRGSSLRRNRGSAPWRHGRPGGAEGGPGITLGGPGIPV